MTDPRGRFPLGAALTLARLDANRTPRWPSCASANRVSWVPSLGGWLVTRRDLCIEVMRDAASVHRGRSAVLDGARGRPEHAVPRRRGPPAPSRPVRAEPSSAPTPGARFADRRRGRGEAPRGRPRARVGRRRGPPRAGRPPGRSASSPARSGLVGRRRPPDAARAGTTTSSRPSTGISGAAGGPAHAPAPPVARARPARHRDRRSRRRRARRRRWRPCRSMAVGLERGA